MNEQIIYVITHKKITPVDIEGYRILLVGANKNNTFENNYVLDNTGDNISDYNDSYCELTGLYWIWKNSKTDIVGLVHYRRLFVKLRIHFDLLGRHVVFNTKDAFRYLERDDINSLLRKYDLIIKRSESRIKTVEEIFINQLGRETFNQISDGINAVCPVYMKTYQVILKAHSHINCNMFIGKKEIINSYCEWLFPILGYIDEKQVRKNGLRYHNREIGYIAELLFGIWITHNKIKYINIPVVFTEDSMTVNGVLSIKELGLFLINRFMKIWGRDRHDQ